MKRFWLNTAGALLGVSVFIACNSDSDPDPAKTDNATPTPAPTSSSTPSAPAAALATIDPAEGSTLGGNVVVLTGTNLDAVSEVRFGTSSALFRLISAERIEAAAPAGAASVQVQVGAKDNLSNALAYAYVAPVAASVANVVPASGPTVGGNTVVLTGKNFTGASQVRFGDRLALFTVESDTKISAVAPAGIDAANVIVTTPAGDSSPASYAYVTGLGLAFMSPLAGATAGGTSVILGGAGFTDATAVTFGGTAATSFTVDADTQITAIAPAGAAGKANVTVTTPQGTSNGIDFGYLEPPTLMSLSEDIAGANGGRTITLMGSGFTGASSVKFGGFDATKFTVDADTQISAVVPANYAGAQPIYVSSPGGLSNAILFTYVEMPLLSTLSPQVGSTAGGTVVTIYGWSLQWIKTVTFDGIPGTNVAIASATKLTVTAPPHAAGSVTLGISGPTGSSGRGNAFTYVAP